MDKKNEPGLIEYIIIMCSTVFLVIVALIFVKLPIFIFKNILLILSSSVGGIISAAYLFPALHTDLPNLVGFIGGFIATLAVIKLLKK